MDKTNKEAWTGGKNISHEAMEKRKVINKKILKFGCLPIIILFVLIGIVSSLTNDSNVTDDNSKVYNDPLKIGKDSLENFVGKPLSFDKLKSWGVPETLDSIDSKYRIIYLKSANVSVVSKKSDDTVLFAGFEKQSAYDYINEILKKRKELLDKQFSAWDGSHIGLTKMIKKAMNDPNSYEHEETLFWDMGNYLIVTTSFRGKNAFGGVVKNFVKAKVDLQGNVLEVIEEGS